MKQLLCVLVLLVPLALSAQVSPAKLKEHYKKIEQSRVKNNVVTSLDTIFVGGSPYAVMIADEGSNLGVKDYTVYSLDGVDLIYISHDGYDKPNPAMTTNNGLERVIYRIFTFLETEEVCEIKWTLGQDLDEIIAKNNLISENVLNKEAAHKFVIKNGKRFSEEKSHISVSINTSTNVGNPYANHYGAYSNYGNVSTNVNTGSSVNTNNSNIGIVERNRSAQLFIFGDKLQQDFKDIGFAKEKTELANGKSYRVIRFTLPDGTLVAEARGESFNSTTLIVTTMKDNKRQSVSYAFAKQIEEVAKYLIDHYYL